MVRAIFFSLLGPLVLSALGPVYFGLTNAPYSMTLIWAMGCTLWWALQPIKAALTDGNWLQSHWYKSVAVGSVVAIFAFAFVLGDSLAYQLAGRYQTEILTLIWPPGAATANILTNGGTP
jgi:hypothetical protein